VAAPHVPASAGPPPVVSPASGDRWSRAGAFAVDALSLAGVILTGAVSRRPVRPLPGEAERRLAGDEALPGRSVRWTHGITLDARPDEIWPWLIQMGCGRAGWYSYDGLDNGGVPSADRIVGELQRAEVGDIFPMRPGAKDSFVLRAREREQWLVLGDAAGSATWAFVLDPVDEVSTRLLTRSTGSYKRFVVGLLLEVLLRPIHFGMQRRQLLNLKRNAEGRSATTSREKTAGDAGIAERAGTESRKGIPYIHGL
jgi:hypothetical protein